MPHVMKTIYKFFLLALAAVGVCSCNDEYQATPLITVSRVVYVSHPDGSRDTTYFGDTLLVGDTARMEMSISGVSHPLKTAQVSSEITALGCAFECAPEVVEQALENDSRPEEGYLHFQPYVMGVRVTYRCVAKGTGDYKVTFAAESMAKEPYSHNSIEATQLIR